MEDGKLSNDNFSYTIRLAYDLSPQVNLYASYATGYKAASVNLSRDSRPILADRPAIASAGLLLNNLTFGSRYAQPEDSRVIEGGIKTNFNVVSVNLTVFDQQIKGFQSNIFTGTGFALLNAGKQSTFGVELESVARPVRGLTFNFGVTYLDPKYDDFTNSSVGDLTGRRPAGIPEWSLLVGGSYAFEMPGGRLVPSATYNWQSRVQLIEGLPGFLVRAPDGSIVDAQPALDAAEPFTPRGQRPDRLADLRMRLRPFAAGVEPQPARQPRSGRHLRQPCATGRHFCLSQRPAYLRGECALPFLSPNRGRSDGAGGVLLASTRAL